MGSGADGANCNPGRLLKMQCSLAGGEWVADSWIGPDTGANSCNTCSCSDGALSCTKMSCAPEPPICDVPTEKIDDESRPSQTTCANTPGWDNGVGLDCALYAQEGFCAGGKVLQEWAVGHFFAFPEEACCVCGGGAVTEAGAAGCADTPGWDNGAGLDCALYAQEGFCAAGNVLQEWAVGTFWAFPEEACCVCGGGA